GHRRERRIVYFFSGRRRHTRWPRDWSSDVCSSDLRYRRRAGLLGDSLEPAWRAHLHVALARARFVLAVSRKPRRQWIWPALVAAKHPMLRRNCLRVVAVSVSRYLRHMYKFFKPGAAPDGVRWAETK